MQDKPIKTRRQKTSGEFYRPGALKRKRLTGAGIRQLENQIFKVLESDHPQSVRHVFYRMTDPRLKVPVEKTESGYRQVKDRLVRMRRAGAVPYGWISDATRQGAPRSHVRERRRLDRAICWPVSGQFVGALSVPCRGLVRVQIYRWGDPKGLQRAGRESLPGGRLFKGNYTLDST